MFPRWKEGGDYGLDRGDEVNTKLSRGAGALKRGGEEGADTHRAETTRGRREKAAIPSASQGAGGPWENPTI